MAAEMQKKPGGGSHRALLNFIGNFDFEGHGNKRMFVEHTLDDKIMSIINRP